MSSSDEEAQSPVLGASSSKAPVALMGSPDDRDSGDEDDGVEVESEPESEEEVTTKKRTRVKDTREWNLIAKWSCADHEPEEIEGLLLSFH